MPDAVDKYEAVRAAIKTLASYGIRPFQTFAELEPGTKFFWVLPRDGGERQCQVVLIRGFGKVWSYVTEPCTCFQDTGSTGLVYKVTK